jgi:DNA-binding transcriptional ArsR family regulator
MNRQNEPVDRATAAEYATWFKALADATRIQIVSLLARRGGLQSAIIQASKAAGAALTA